MINTETAATPVLKDFVDYLVASRVVRFPGPGRLGRPIPFQVAPLIISHRPLAMIKTCLWCVFLGTTSRIIRVGVTRRVQNLELGQETRLK